MPRSCQADLLLRALTLTLRIRIPKAPPPPVAVDGGRDASADRMRHRHADHGAQTGDSPGCMLKERGRDHATHAAAELTNEGLAWGANGAEGTNRNDYEPHAGRQLAVLRVDAGACDSSMGPQAGSISMVSINMISTGSIESLNVNKSVRVRTIKVGRRTTSGGLGSPAPGPCIH